MKTILLRLQNLHGWLRLVWWLCLLGVLTNAVLMWNDLATGRPLLRLHFGFFILYLSQVIFMLLHERMVWILAVLQGVVALITNGDFIFYIPVRAVGQVIYGLFGEPSIQGMKTYRYVMSSAAFTLQMLTAYAQFSLLSLPHTPAEQENAETGS